MYRALLSLLAAGAVSAQDYDADYLPGTLTPKIDLGLQEVDIEVPGKYRDRVPEDLSVNLPPGFRARLFAAIQGGRETSRSARTACSTPSPGGAR